MWPQNVIECVVSDLVSRANAFGRIKSPVNSQENSTGRIFRRRLAEALIMPRQNLPHVIEDHVGYRIVNVARYAIELVGDEIAGNRKVHVVGLIEVGEKLERCPATGRSAGKVGR